MFDSLVNPSIPQTSTIANILGIDISQKDFHGAHFCAAIKPNSCFDRMVA
jgi:hypothetical protein